MNSSGLILTVVLAFLGAATAGYLVLLYNSLIQVRNNIAKAWHNLDVLLLQRNEEIPKLIEITRFFTRYEKDLLTEIVSLRQRFGQATRSDRKAPLENELAAKLRQLLGAGESHPELRANRLFRQVQERLSDLESMIADRRTFFNDTVTIYNVQCESFPQLVFARQLGFCRHPLLVIPGEKSG